jgi:hypothetical protein
VHSLRSDPPRWFAPLEFVRCAEQGIFSRLTAQVGLHGPGVCSPESDVTDRSRFSPTSDDDPCGRSHDLSIVAEYFHFKGQVLSTFGLGAEISSATDAGNFAVLLLSTIVMATLVVSVNRLVWRPLYRRAETRYRLEA